MEQNKNGKIKKSELVETFLESTPNWFWMSGTYLITGFLIVFLFLSWLIKYPEIVPIEISLNPISPPISLYSLNSGNIMFFCSEEDTVQINQDIAYVKTNVKYSDFKSFSHFVDIMNIDTLIANPNSIKNFQREYALGEIEPFYQNFIQKVNEYKVKFNNKPTIFLAKSIQNQINETEDLLQLKKNKKIDYIRKLNLAENAFNRNKRLFSKGVISKAELEEEESSYLGAQLLIKNIDIDIDETNIQLIELGQNLREMTLNVSQERENLIKEIQDNYNLLSGAINKWEKEHLIISPIEGIVYFSGIWGKNQFVHTNTEIAVISPITESNIIGKGTMPIYNSGKVKIGQEVVVRLDNYNFTEYGALIGEIQNISPLTKNNKYSVTVTFPSKGVSTYGKILNFDKELIGRGGIITEDIRLLERYFYQMRGVLKNNR